MKHLGLALALCAACGSHGSAAGEDAGSGGTDTPGCPSFDTGPIGGDRPVTVHVPPGYDACVATPLVVMLHGYTASGSLEELYLQVAAVADARGFLYAAPDGTVDNVGNHFWNATDACCNLSGSTVDDSAYLSGLIVEIGHHYNVDPKRVFLVGHSNGAFMSYRMACDHSDQIAAIASLAGAMYSDVTKCAAATPVSVLEIHGTLDAVIPYNGGAILGHAFPSAPTSVSDWATSDGCTAPETSAPPLDLDTLLIGNETTVTTYAGCHPGGFAELWTIEGGGHLPAIAPTFSSQIVDFLFAHPKP